MGAIGFSGPRVDMTTEQAATLTTMLDGVLPAWRTLRQGCCTQCDEQAAAIARGLGFWIIGHPGVSGRDGRALHRSTFVCDVTLPERPYLARNRDIVRMSAVLIATPLADHRPRGKVSGTWFTIEYAWQVGTIAYLILPDGSVRIRDPRRAAPLTLHPRIPVSGD